MIAALCTLIVGAVLLASAALKAVDAAAFMEHIVRYRLVNPRWILPLGLFFIGFEAALATALILHTAPRWLAPATMALFIGFAVLTLWGDRSGRIEDCGCYGGLLAVSPAQSALLDLAYALLLVPAWLLAPAGPPACWQIAGIVVAAVAAVWAARRSLAEPLVELSRLRKGGRWKPGWLGPKGPDFGSGEHFVVFMDRECSFCKRWVPLLNVINVQPDLPRVTGIMSRNHEELEAFQQEHLIRFPIARMDRLRAGTMIRAFPTAVLIRDGRIEEKWAGEMPKAYLDRVRRFYESIWGNSQKDSVFSG